MARLRTLRQALPGAIALVAVTLLAPGGAAASGGEGIEIFPDVPTTWDRILSPELFASPLVQLLALFALLIWPANQLLWRPLLRVFEARSERIAGSRARAEKIASEADDVLGAYEAAVERARRGADGDRAQILEGARQEQSQLTADARRAAEVELSAARDAVDAALERARTGLEASADELGRQAAAQVLGRPLS